MLKLGQLTPLFVALALGAAACGDDDVPDVGPADTGPFDGGVTSDSGADTGVRDTGTDSGVVPDSGQTYCAANNTTVLVDGQNVTIDPTTARATNLSGEADLDCIDDRFRDDPFDREFCVAECINFFGATPTQSQVDALQFAVFRLSNGAREINAGFNPATGADLEPNERLNISARVLSVTPQTCPSGWKLDMVYRDLGEEFMFAQLDYVVRIKSSTVAAAWPTQYHRYSKRNDDVSNAPGLCDTVEARPPVRGFEFPIIPLSMLAEGIGEGGPIPGSADLFDGRGHGYLMAQVRDCNANGGLGIAHATAGTNPRPLGDFYPETNYSLELNSDETTANGLYFAVGFTGMAVTSTRPFDVITAFGVDRGQQCTEGWAGTHVNVYPDAITFLPANRKYVLH